MKRTGFKPRKISMRDAYAAKLRKNGAPAPKPRKPLKRVSSTRQIAGKVYSDRRKTFMEANQTCHAHPMLFPDDPAPQAVDVHHAAGRTGTNFLDVTTWIATCRSCHEYIHAHGRQARALGLLR